MFTEKEYKKIAKAKEVVDELRAQIVKKIRKDIVNVEKYFSAHCDGIKPKAKIMKTYFELQKVIDPTFVKGEYAHNPLDGYYSQDSFKEFVSEIHKNKEPEHVSLQKIFNELGIKWFSIPSGSPRTIQHNTHKPVIASATFKPAQSGFFILKTARKYIGVQLASNNVGGQTDHSVKPIRLWKAVAGIKEYEKYGQKIYMPDNKIINELVTLEKQKEVIAAL